MAFDPTRLEQQMQFIVEIDKAKQVLRQTVLMDGSRRENDAEHSWHLAMMALVLAEYAGEEIDIGKVIRLLLVHDLVEIDAGDTYAYDDEAQLDKGERETSAADRLFRILPEDQAGELYRLWEEYEARKTPEATFAKALDHLQPLLHNYHNQGSNWRQHRVTREQVLAKKREMAASAPALWEYARSLTDDAVKKGFLGE